MFKKHKIAFSEKNIFGKKFKADIETCFCVISKLLFNEKINLDGTIDISFNSYFNNNKKISELWSYIYYLCFYNRSFVPVFKRMMNKYNKKISAENFYSTVIIFTRDDIDPENIPIITLDARTLIIFINKVIEQYNKIMINPIFDYLGVLMKKNSILKGTPIGSAFGSIKIETGNNSNNYKKSIKIVTNPSNIKNANVKISFQQNN